MFDQSDDPSNPVLYSMPHLWTKLCLWRRPPLPSTKPQTAQHTGGSHHRRWWTSRLSERAIGSCRINCFIFAGDMVRFASSQQDLHFTNTVLQLLSFLKSYSYFICICDGKLKKKCFHCFSLLIAFIMQISEKHSRLIAKDIHCFKNTIDIALKIQLLFRTLQLSWIKTFNQ